GRVPLQVEHPGERVADGPVVVGHQDARAVLAVVHRAPLVHLPTLRTLCEKTVRTRQSGCAQHHGAPRAPSLGAGPARPSQSSGGRRGDPPADPAARLRHVALRPCALPFAAPLPWCFGWCGRTPFGATASPPVPRGGLAEDHARWPASTSAQNSSTVRPSCSAAARRLSAA